MMLTVHGLPNKTKLQDVKILIKQECNIPDFILDNLVEDGYDSKKVRIGLTNENDGYRLMKCLEGFRMSGSHILKVIPVGKQPQPTFEPRYSNQQQNDYQRPDYPSQEYGRPISTTIGTSHISPRGAHPRAGDRVQSDRQGLDSRHPPSLDIRPSTYDRYEGSLNRSRAPDRPTDIRTNDSSRGPLVPPTLRGPLDSRATHSVLESRGAHVSLDTRPHVSLDMRGSLDSRGLHGSLDTRAPQGSLNSRATHGSLDSRAPHGSSDFRAPHGPLDSRQLHGSLNARSVQGSLNSRAPQGSLDSRPPHGSPLDSRAPHGPQDSRGSHGSLDSRAPHGSLDSRGPHGSLDSRGPHGSLDSRGPHGSIDSRAPGLDSRAPHGSLDSRGPRGSLDSRAPHGSIDTRGPDQRQPEPARQPQWVPVGGNNQWGAQPTRPVQPQNSSYYQQSQGNSGYGQQPNNSQPGSYAQGRAPQAPGYMAPHATNTASERAPTRSNVLRSVEMVDTPIQPRAAPAYPQQQKPITIMKDNFQGPTQYNLTGQPQPQSFQQPWVSQGQQTKQLTYDKTYDDRRIAQEKRPEVKPTGQEYDKRRFSPSRGRQMSPGRRLVSPPRNASTIPPRTGQAYPEPSNRPFQSDRRPSPSRHVPSIPGREFSPGRRVSPARKVSPIGRRVSPSRRISPSRRGSPLRKHSPVRRISPTRKISPLGRRISPSSRRISPSRKISPTGRRVSPTGRRVSPTGRRVSPPGRRISPTGRRVSPPGKRVSPGRRDEARRMSPNVRRMGGRLESPPRRYSPKRMSPTRGSGRYSPTEKVKYEPDPGSKGAKPIRPAYEPTQAQKFQRGLRANESVDYPAPAPARADAVPKISPWQNEKITFPKKNERDTRMGRSDLADKKRSPGRQSRSPNRSRSPVKDRFRRHSPSPRSPRRSWALEKRRSPESIREPPPPPLWPGQDAQDKAKHPVWETRRNDDRREFDDNRGEKYTPRFSPKRDDEYRGDYEDDYRRQSPRRDDKKVFHDIDKDFNDIYQRAVEFRRKTEERKSGDRRREGYDRSSDDDVYIKEDSPRVEVPPAKKPEWVHKIEINLPKEVGRFKLRLDPEVKAKRDKAVDEIATKMLEPYIVPGEHRTQIIKELKINIFKIMLEMFKAKDVSYIELVIKFRARYDAKDEERILSDVLAGMPSHYRSSMKRKAPGITEVPPKKSRHSPEPYAREEPPRPKLADSIIPDWNIGLTPPKVLSMPLATPGIPPIVNTAPLMVQPPVYVPTYQGMDQIYPQSTSISAMQSDILAMQANYQSRLQTHLQENVQPERQTNIPVIREEDDVYNLYLCQDDFEPFSDHQAERLKNFLVSQMFKASETGDGWAPDFALKGLHSMYRYELSTKDEASKDWIYNLDFSDFEFFNVLVYTKEELWYERAAIWLPGHSRCMKLEPLEKLRLQNQNAEGVNVGKWKFVKKVVTAKGTRLYVDMPPSSARALEKKNMLLSYELQKVTVLLKAMAVDKDSFDAGLKTFSITDPSMLANAIQTSLMPTLNIQQAGIIKVTLNGAKSITIQQAGKIKEMILYNLFKYHQQEGRSKTDFIKYGFCPPNAIGIEPENDASKRWLLSRVFGKLNKQSIVVMDGDDVNTKYFRMKATVIVGLNKTLSSIPLIIERLKHSNRGVKGLNYHLWKPLNIIKERSKTCFEVDVDLESVEALIRLKFRLDVVLESNTVIVHFKSDYSLSKLQEKIQKFKSEQVDVYDVANMEIDSDSD